MGVRAVKAAVFLDRDGVLNRALIGPNGDPRPPSGVAELEILPLVPEAVRRLRCLGFELVVVTNQPDVARGTLDAAAVTAVNEVLARELDLDHFRICPHDDLDGCDCRKPAPGLLIGASRDLGLDITRSYMVGDRWRDIEAGKRAGCKTILLDSGWTGNVTCQPDHSVRSLWEAAAWIAASEGRTPNDECA